MSSSSEILTARQQVSIPFRYRLFRALVRIAFAFQFHCVRLLQAELLPDSGPTLLFISRPERFLDALILVAALERDVRCLVDRKVLRGPAQRLLAWGLGMILIPTQGDQSSSALEAARAALVHGDTLAVFFLPPQAAQTPQAFIQTATLALEAELAQSDQLGLMILPVHLHLPASRLRSREPLIHVSEPLFPEDYLSGHTPEQQASALAEALRGAARQNPFRLHTDSVDQFLAGMEQLLRGELEHEWASRSNWKQEVDGFTLSALVKDWADSANDADSAQLVALRELLDGYREARRQRSLRQLQIETQERFGSRWGRLSVWAESLVGFPLACYGLVNHLIIGLLLFGSGLLKRKNQKVSPERWFARVLIVLGCYSGQIAFVAHWMGRAAAGYYAVTLPVSGAYLWHYGWLFWHRTRLLLSLAAPVGEAKVQRLCRGLLERFDRAQRGYAETLGVPRSVPKGQSSA